MMPALLVVGSKLLRGLTGWVISRERQSGKPNSAAADSLERSCPDLAVRYSWSTDTRCSLAAHFQFVFDRGCFHVFDELWWRRRESNPRPKLLSSKRLHAQPTSSGFALRTQKRQDARIASP